MPFHHVSLPVGKHYILMRDFYTAILQPLGYKLVVEGEAPLQYCGYGVEGRLDFWLGGGAKENGLEKYDGDLAKRPAPVHIAFAANDRDHVNQWYEHAIKAGATDNGKPGLRDEYMPNYYAAFVLDPLGNNIEIVHVTY
ncbi:Glyoxalase/Bleomycin resistance protein/Dihydroxybiphenyl dioxygenase [Mariannaea sp. PMI_226]|nr:Glyoxalase/Bleomycin resistance protein/Dihydroxybiphenyl dioxygenase [Mariannaea sp. PMI_226]